MQYTNLTNIPLPLAVFLATDDYDYVPNTISATTLLKPLRQIVLSKRLAKEDVTIDISSLVSARMGTAIHTAIEKAWSNPTNALKALNYPEKVYKNIVINPEKVEKGQIPVYMEQRSSKTVMGMTVSGKFDFVAEGKVQDFKSTSTYTYLNQSNVEKYQLQGSIYRWLNPEIITKDMMNIHYIFTDWSKLEAMKNKEYPQQRVLTQTIPLLSIEATDNWVRNKVKLIKLYEDTDERELPLCTDEELWRKPTVWKYYKNPSNTTKSTKNFDNYADAMKRFAEDGSIGLVKEVKGTVVACKYCPAFIACSQKDLYLENGDLQI